MNQRHLMMKRLVNRYAQGVSDKHIQPGFGRTEKLPTVILPVADLVLGWRRESVIVL